MICEDCKKECERKSNNQKRCKDCVIANEKEYGRKRRESAIYRKEQNERWKKWRKKNSIVLNKNRCLAKHAANERARRSDPVINSRIRDRLKIRRDEKRIAELTMLIKELARITKELDDGKSRNCKS